MIHTQLDNKLIATDIEEQLTQKQSFIDYVVNDDIYAAQVARYKQVNVPQAGALPDVEINSTSALSLISRSDTYTDYTLHSYRTNPILVRHFEDYFTNYEKQQSITSEQATQLKDTFSKHSMHTWADQVNESTGKNNRKLLSSGTNRSSSVGTGNRKAFTFNDLLSVRKQLSKDGGNQSAGNYIGVINADMYSDLLKIEEVRQSYHKLTPSERSGAVAEFMAFTIFLREDLPVFQSGAKSATLVDLGTTAPNAGSSSAIFFHKDMIRRAVSCAISVFLEVSAGSAGVELSSEVFAGSTLARTDAKGCVLLLESA